jgi:hypothetical protein
MVILSLFYEQYRYVHDLFEPLTARPVDGRCSWPSSPRGMRAHY